MDEHQPKPREFHQAVFDGSTETMYVVGGSESQGRVNYVHKFSWRPENYNTGYVFPSTLIAEIAGLQQLSNVQKSFLQFEFICKDSSAKKVCTLFAPVAFVKMRCPRLFR